MSVCKNDRIFIFVEAIEKSYIRQPVNWFVCDPDLILFVEDFQMSL